MGAWCTISTHATFIPLEDHRDAEKVVLDSQSDVNKWTTDFPRDEIDREDGLGLEFECQLNTTSLARLHQFRKLGGTNIMALRKALLDKQDLLQMDAGGFVDEGYHTTRGDVVGQSQSQGVLQAVHLMRKSMVGHKSRSRRMVRPVQKGQPRKRRQE